MDARSGAQPICRYWQATRRSRRAFWPQPEGTGQHGRISSSDSLAISTYCFARPPRTASHLASVAPARGLFRGSLRRRNPPKGGSMNKTLIVSLLLAGCAATDSGHMTAPRAGTGAGPTQAELTNAGRNTDDVVTYGMGYDHNRYSPLRQINKGNVKQLVPVWNVSLQNDLGEQAQPLVYDGIMYVSNARWTYAIDAVTGKMIWRTAVEYDPDTPRVVCCGVSNKGVAIYEGKVFRTTLDAHVIALDQVTGKELWKQKVAEWKEGYSLTVAPLIANGVLITGCSGAEFGARCFLDGWDPATGKKLCRCCCIDGPSEL